MEFQEAQEILAGLRAVIHKEFVGKEEIVDKVLACFLAEGHVLLEDVPGIGKTTLAKVLAGALGLSFGRIQFTPDTLPGDITGVSVYQMKTGEFTWKPGPVMNQLLLADEINRTSPKTQAGLMEVMAEGQVSVDGESIPLPKPFMVIATENPIEFAGTYSLPEAQLDRFMMRLSLGYPEKEKELQIARQELGLAPIADADEFPEEAEKTQTMAKAQKLSTEELLALIAVVKEVKVSDAVLDYAEEVVRATRADSRLRLGGSTRAVLALLRAARAQALLNGRDFVKPDDVKNLAVPVLAHRLVLSPDARRQHLTAQKILSEILIRVRIPV